MDPVQPIETVELFPPLSAELLRLLKALPRDAWDNPTACPGWTVRDVAAHLLGGSLGRLSSAGRPAAGETSAPLSYAELVVLIDRQNAEWVRAARRINPDLLLQFLELSEPRLYDYFKSLPPFELSRIGVAWAGEGRSPNWFDIAREYTEKWLHQQHIREAVGEPVLSGRKWLFPVLDTFLRALPYTYTEVAAGEGTTVQLVITGEAGGEWALVRQADAWQLYWGAASEPAATVRMDADLAWRLLTRGVSPDDVQAGVHIEGDRALGGHVLRTVSIMA